MVIHVASEDGMKELGARLAEAFKRPGGPRVLELIGDIGAGKTTLVKGLARGLGVAGDVASPSFTISRVYDAGGPANAAGEKLRLYHYDFYRLTDAGILRDELAEVTGDPLTVTVVEWAEIVADVLPEPHVRLSIRATGESRREVTVYGIEEGSW